MAMQKPRVGGRAKATVPGEKIEYGTIIEVSPSGRRYQVEWDQPDECGQTISMHELSPASYVRPV